MDIAAYFPSPTLPMKGRVPISAYGTIEHEPLTHTLPFMGRAGEGTSQALGEHSQ